MIIELENINHFRLPPSTDLVWPSGNAWPGRESPTRNRVALLWISNMERSNPNVVPFGFDIPVMMLHRGWMISELSPRLESPVDGEGFC